MTCPCGRDTFEAIVCEGCERTVDTCDCPEDKNACDDEEAQS